MKIIENLSEIGSFYSSHKLDQNKKNVLLYSHELKLGGAPVVLGEMGKVLLKKYNVYIMSPTDGMMRQDFLDAGMSVIVCSDITEEEKNCIVNNVEFVVASTILTLTFVCQLINRGIPIFWWIHENTPNYKGREVLKPYYKMACQYVKIYAGGYVAQNNFETFCGITPKILELGVKDFYQNELDNRKHEKIRFICPSSIHYVKGQDILSAVIQLLTEDERQQCEFFFFGQQRPDNKFVYDEVVRIVQEYDNVKLLEPVPKAKYYELYYDCDVVMAPSREDCAPTVIVEGMSCNKICICSDGTGVSKYMTDGKNGFVFKSGDIFDALEKVRYVIRNYNKLQSVRYEARKIYERVYSQEVFEQNIWRMIEDKKN